MEEGTEKSESVESTELLGKGGATHRLSRLVDQHRPKLELRQPRVTATNTSSANNVRIAQDLLLHRPCKRLELAFVRTRELALLLLELNELLQLGVGVGVGDLSMKGEEGDGGFESFAGLGGDADDLETGRVDLLGELVDGDVGGGGNEDLTGVHLREMVDDGGRGDGLSGTGGTLSTRPRRQPCSRKARGGRSLG